jgi:hypothetical protein
MSSILLNNSYVNVFYVEGKNGEVFAVSVRCFLDGRGWYVGVWGARRGWPLER